MKNNLVETVKFSFTAEIIDQLGKVIGEDVSAVKTGLAQAIPLVLNTLLYQAENEGNPAALLHLARETDAASVLTRPVDVADAAWYEQGGTILVELLGSTYGATVSQLALDADMQPVAAERLLQMVAAAVLGVLGKFAADNGLTPTAFTRALRAQKDNIGAAMLPTLHPAGAAVATTTGSRPPATTPPRVATAPLRRVPPLAAGAPTPMQAAPAARDGGGVRWQWGLLLLLAVSLGYFFGHDRFNSAAPSAPATEAAAPAGSSTTPPVAAGRYDQNRDTYIYDTGQPIILTLSDGTSQKVGANSTENRLYTFLSKPTIQVDSVNRTKGWINFDRVYFEPGKATLTPESAQQLRNVASILKSFPKAVVKIGGYTDSSGVALHNFQLSEERAKAAMLTLATQGVPVGNLQYKGYGARYFITSNKTLAGRALNRRISVRVISK